MYHAALVIAGIAGSIAILWIGTSLNVRFNKVRPLWANSTVGRICGVIIAWFAFLLWLVIERIW
jgi:hypothetical protein